MGRLVRGLAALLCVVTTLLLAPSGMAEASLGAYKIERLPGGETRYVFDEVSVTTPASWTGKVVVMEYGNFAAFCHESSNRLWRQKNGDETGGLLFALCVDDTTDHLQEPACQNLGRTDRGYYYLSFPTDLQACVGEEDQTGEYMALWSQIDFIRQSAEVQAFHTPPSPQGGREASAAGMVREVTFDERSAPYDGEWLPFEDGFQLYVPRAWQALDLSEAESAAGMFYQAGDGSSGVAVSYLSAGKLRSCEDLARDLGRAGFEGIERLALNGIDAVGFERPSDGYRGVAFYHPSVDGYILFVYAFPQGDAGCAALLDSVSPYGIH